MALALSAFWLLHAPQVSRPRGSAQTRLCVEHLGSSLLDGLGDDFPTQLGRLSFGIFRQQEDLPIFAVVCDVVVISCHTPQLNGVGEAVVDQALFPTLIAKLVAFQRDLVSVDDLQGLILDSGSV